MLSLKGKKKKTCKRTVSLVLLIFFFSKGIDAFVTAGLSLKVDLKIV